MTDIAEVARSVRRRWLSQGLRVVPIEFEDLQALRRSSPSGLPEAYEAFLRIAGLPQDEDSEGFRFWPPRQVRMTSDVLAEAGYACAQGDRSAVIADYLQESWWYCMWLEGPLRGHVSVVLGDARGRDPQPPLGTLADFLLAYLNDGAGLYPPASRPEHA